MPHYRIDDPNNQPPRDGTLIDLWTGNGERIPDVRWNPKRGCWESWGIDGFDHLSWVALEFPQRVTHWSPIVPPMDEPQESAIRWYGPEVAAEWPEGSVVLAVNESNDWLSLDNNFDPDIARTFVGSTWVRYALIKRGGGG